MLLNSWELFYLCIPFFYVTTAQSLSEIIYKIDHFVYHLIMLEWNKRVLNELSRQSLHYKENNCYLSQYQLLCHTLFLPSERHNVRVLGKTKFWNYFANILGLFVSDINPVSFAIIIHFFWITSLNSVFLSNYPVAFAVKNVQKWRREIWYHDLYVLNLKQFLNHFFSAQQIP